MRMRSNKQMLIPSVLLVIMLIMTMTLMAVAPVDAADTWYVDVGACPAPGTGTSADPFCSIQAAINAAISGDTVYVLEGTYLEHITIRTPSLTLQGENRETTIIDGGGSGNVIYINHNTHRVTISGLTVTNGEYGIRLPNTHGSNVVQYLTVRDAIITSNKMDGIEGALLCCGTASNSLIEDSVLSNNIQDGFYVHQFGYSTIRNCEVFGNGRHGLNLASTTDILATNNKVHDNVGIGIYLAPTEYSIVEKNNVYSNDIGIKSLWLTNDIIRENIIHENNVGIAQSSFRHNTHTDIHTGNIIYHNDLIDNVVHQAIDGFGAGDNMVPWNNKWDDGYPSGGNYWSDYTGADNNNGPDQDITGSDGIGDTPYIIGIDQDNYPLMSPWNIVQQPPDCSAAAASIDSIWPPNHKFVDISVFGVTDPDGDSVTITIDSIFQDEPVDTFGDGKFTPDGIGVGTDTAEVRAERAGTKKVPGNGRVYHINFTADDGKGGSCSGEVLVGVPHDKGKRSVPVDEGALYDSTAFTL